MRDDVDIAERIGRLCSPRIMLTLAFVTAAFLHRRPGASRVPLATLVSIAATRAAKHVVGRARPSWFADDRESFPSGHGASSTAYLLATALAVPRRHRRLALGVAAATIAAIDATRVLAREHWPSDVIAGDLVGMLSVGAADTLVR